MTSKFLSRNGEIYRVLHQDEDTCWVISFDTPTEHPFCIAAAELGSYQRVPAPQNFAPEDSTRSPAAQKRLALIQPLLAEDLAAITNHRLRALVARSIANRQNTTARRVLRFYINAT